jgi:predicted PurR-regulated permease PerM
MTGKIFNQRFKQVFLLILIVSIAVLLISELTMFIPGFLGGITLYIISRNLFFKLVYEKKWKKGLTAMLFILAYLIMIAIPVYLSIELIKPKMHAIAENQDKLLQGVQLIIGKLEKIAGVSLFNEENAKMLAGNISSIIPGLLNSTAVLLTNLIMMFFIYYYMLIAGINLEKYLSKIIPLKKDNIHLLAIETKDMIRANALGIPVICIIQGVTASLGYWIFGVTDWGMWGFFTGLFAFFPFVGTMIIWVPLVAYMFATGLDWQATALLFYSLLITGNVDYVARITLMKKIGDVHPLITILGVIVGLNLFGFVGLIFGPLLVSYFLVLTKIYINEFAVHHEEYENEIESPSTESSQ